MKLLITGSSGFIGTNFVKSSKDYSIYEVDLLARKVEKISFKDINTVLHLAAIVHQLKGAPTEKYYKINRDLALDVAKKAKLDGVNQFILMSTTKVFGENINSINALNESSLCKPTDAYGKSKLEAEELIMGLEDDNFKVAIVRSPMVYGPGVKANMLNFIKLVDWVPVLPFGGKNNLRSMVYVGNLVSLIKHIIEKQASGIFIAGDQYPLSTMDLVKLISKALGKKRFLIQFPKFILNFISLIKPAYFYRLFGSIIVDNSKTNTSLNFVPPFSSEEGIIDMVNWYKLRKLKK